MSKLINKKTGIALLIVVLLISISACSGALQDGEAESPATPDLEQVENNEPNNGTSEDSSQPGEEDVTGNDTDDQSDAEKILEGYYYSKVDVPIKDFELEDLQGNNVGLSDFNGKVVFLNFWATWCPPCREEMPHMQVFHEKYGDDIVILAVNPNRTETYGGVGVGIDAEEKVRDFIEEEGYTFPILMDPDDSVWDMYRQRGIPANYMIDREGVIRYLKPGAFMSLEEMEAFASALGVNID